MLAGVFRRRRLCKSGCASRAPVADRSFAEGGDGHMATVNLHNRWQVDWRVIITVLGWLMTIGGIMRIVLPQFTVAVGATIYSGRASTIVAALVVGTLGAFLSFTGYVPQRPRPGTTGF